jgi:hypothetical protein
MKVLPTWDQQQRQKTPLPEPARRWQMLSYRNSVWIGFNLVYVDARLLVSTADGLSAKAKTVRIKKPAFMEKQLTPFISIEQQKTTPTIFGRGFLLLNIGDVKVMPAPTRF